MAQPRLPGIRRAARRRGLGPREAQEILDTLRRDAARVAGRFGLTYRSILAERASASHYGICTEDGLIKIRLQHATRGTPLKHSSLIHTLCHELAHLRHFDHGSEFRKLLARILAWARGEGIYRPGRGAAVTPARECGVDAATRRRFLEEMRIRIDRAVPASQGQLPLFGPGA